MTTIHQMAERWQSLNLKKEVGDVVNQEAKKMVEIQKAQLMKGLDRDGKPLAPKHSDNPYFKTQEAGLRYAKWKQKLFPETPFNVPNLNINGYYHSEITIVAVGDKMVIDSAASFAASVSATFRDKHLGLNKDSAEKAWRSVLRVPSVQRIGQITGCTVK